ncbi:5-formyltetrahydrofolate cyclo-ligase-like [Apostichopus japonicus]|uniref:5-formyltetrahydrofolate cyclo-ligase-like n=1 Tax=Stichopus japonicus TaxID=307972 RepID=UPI003AB67681
MSSIAVHEAKQMLRKELKKRIAALSVEERANQSQYVITKLISHPIYKRSQRISVYLPMIHEEVNTEGILRHIFKSKKSCFIPQYIGPKMEMLKLYSMEDYQSLPVTKWNIKQPATDDKREEALSSGGLDLIIMPGLGFSTDGDRIGRGKAYYDTYLKRCSEHQSGMPKTIAVAFKEQILEDIPTTDSDQKVDHVLFGYMDEG